MMRRIIVPAWHKLTSAHIVARGGQVATSADVLRPYGCNPTCSPRLLGATGSP